jgi:hypothetical protein
VCRRREGLLGARLRDSWRINLNGLIGELQAVDELERIGAVRADIVGDDQDAVDVAFGDRVVGAVAAIDSRIDPAATFEKIVAGIATKRVVANTAAQMIVAAATPQGVIAAAAKRNIGEQTPNDLVRYYGEALRPLPCVPSMTPTPRFL